MPAKIKRVRAMLFAKGISLHEFCKAKGVSYHCARDLLTGRANGSRGKTHLAAVALGLKPDPATLNLPE